MPVDYDKLIPSLRAYSIIKSKMNALRSISALPQELYDQIRDSMKDEMVKEKKKQNDHWSNLGRCYRGDCHYRYRHMESLELLSAMEDCAYDTGFYMNRHDSAFMEMVEERLCMDCDEWGLAEVHDEREAAYQQYVPINAPVGFARVDNSAAEIEAFKEVHT